MQEVDWLASGFEILMHAPGDLALAVARHVDHEHSGVEIGGGGRDAQRRPTFNAARRRAERNGGIGGSGHHVLIQRRLP